MKRLLTIFLILISTLIFSAGEFDRLLITESATIPIINGDVTFSGSIEMTGIGRGTAVEQSSYITLIGDEVWLAPLPSTSIALGDLTDVELIAPTTNDLLGFNGLKWENIKEIDISGIATASAFRGDGLGITGITATQILTSYDSGGYQRLQEYIDITGNAGAFVGGTCTDNGDGSVAVTETQGLIKISNSATASLEWVTIPASASVVVTDNAETYIYVDYTDLTRLYTTSAGSTIRANERTQFELCETYREGTAMHVAVHTQMSGEIGKLIQQRSYDQFGITRTSGMILSETATRNIVVTAGEYWLKLYKGNTAAIDTSGTDTYTYYFDSASWTASPSQTAWDNEQYDNAGVLTSITNNRYACHYWWMESDGDLIMVYGQAQYVSLAGAEDETVPTPPPRVIAHGIFIAKTCFQEGGSTFLSILNPFDTMLEGSAASDHGNLAGLTDDDHSQYFLVDGTRNITGTATFEQDITITGDASISQNLDVTGNATISGVMSLPNIATVVAQSYYLAIDDGVIKQAPTSGGDPTVENFHYRNFDAWGSTNTKIPTFVTAQIDTTGTIAEITQTASAGIAITSIATMSVVSNFGLVGANSGGTSMGISLNSSQLTTAIASITEADVRCINTLPTGATTYSNCMAPVIMYPGDVLRPHADAGASGQGGGKDYWTGFVTRVTE